MDHRPSELAGPFRALERIVAERLALAGPSDDARIRDPGRYDALPALRSAASALALSLFETDVLALLLHRETCAEPPEGRSEHRVTTVERVMQQLGVDASMRSAAVATLVPGAPLRRWGLVELEGDEPFMQRRLRVVEAVWPLLMGISRPHGRFAARAADPELLERLVLAPGLRERLERLVGILSAPGDARQLVVVCGEPGAGRGAVARSIAGQLGAPTLEVSLESASSSDLVEVCRAARLQDAALVLVGDELGPADARRLVEGVGGHVFWLAPSRARRPTWLPPEVAASFVEVRWPEREQRAELWRRGLAETVAADANPKELGHRLRFGPGDIARAMTVARDAARLAGRSELTREDLQEGCRRVAAPMGRLAQRLELNAAPDDLILPPDVWTELDLVLSWLRHGGRIVDEWDTGRRLGVGRAMICLLHGPPGTGKTLAARVIARQVGLDLYRVDLSQVVDKYIGETEKNLAELFRAAKAANAILLFDEADAVFGKRTEVKDAHDRYANLETGYLLQCVEEHEGCVILASNLRRNFDEAFTRRIHVIAEVPRPGPAERRLIWEGHIPRTRGDDVDVDFLAERFDIAGGDIRNAVLTAGLLAAADDELVGMPHLVRGLWRELLKSGRSPELSSLGPWRETVERVRRPDVRGPR